ncbi:MAG: hypothetical protein HZB38_09015 [Planctomycetes bacterium]|nr:hypothetical protein [Planctomycetota bacterium]
MLASVRTLLGGTIDYAGLFPPAQLDLPAAAANFSRYLGEPSAWLLGRFVCPAAKFADLSKLLPDAPTARWPVISLGRGGETADAFLSGVDADLAAMGALRAGRPGAPVEAFEVRLPADLLAHRDGKAVRALLDATAARFEHAGFGAVPRYFEAALAEPWRESVRSVIAGIARHNHKILPHFGPDFRVDTSPQPPPDGFKLRTGGLVASAFPSTEQVAFVIEQCRDAHVPMKFTAGLHHPVRRFDPSVRTMMHGFLNVFVAATLAHAAAFDFHDILGVVEELDANVFQFGDDYLSWNDADASIDEIQYVRRERALSFGSCSFDEPREDLAAMRLID